MHLRKDTFNRCKAIKRSANESDSIHFKAQSAFFLNSRKTSSALNNSSSQLLSRKYQSITNMFRYECFPSWFENPKKLCLSILYLVYKILCQIFVYNPIRSSKMLKYVLQNNALHQKVCYSNHLNLVINQFLSVQKTSFHFLYHSQISCLIEKLRNDFVFLYRFHLCHCIVLFCCDFNEILSDLRITKVVKYCWI
jgi:hypothetical protein